MNTYVVRINKKDNSSVELKSFPNLKEAFDFFLELNINDLEETNGAIDEYELVKINENKEIVDWENYELKSISWTENTWVIKTKNL